MPAPDSAARQDARTITRHYFKEGDPDLANRCVAAFRSATLHIAQYPASGSPAYRADTGITDLRVWPIRGFPYLIFYQ